MKKALKFETISRSNLKTVNAVANLQSGDAAADAWAFALAVLSLKALSVFVHQQIIMALDGVFNEDILFCRNQKKRQPIILAATFYIISKRL